MQEKNLKRLEILKKELNEIIICPLSISILQGLLLEYSKDEIEQKEAFKFYQEKTKNKPPYLIKEPPEIKNQSPIDRMILDSCYENEVKKFREDKNQIRLLKYMIWWIKEYNKGLLGEYDNINL